MSTPLTELDGVLTQLREVPKYNWAGTVISILLGLFLATVHWIGLVIGGALVGLVAANLVRAMLAGFGFGVLVLVVWALLLWSAGSLGEASAMGQIPLVAVAMGLFAPVFGSLVRGVV